MSKKKSKIKKSKIKKSIYEAEGWELFNKEVEEFVGSIGVNIEGHLRAKFGELEGVAVGEAIKRSEIRMRISEDDGFPNKRVSFHVCNSGDIDGILVPPDDEWIQSENFYLMDFLRKEDFYNDFVTFPDNQKYELIVYLNQFKRAVEYLEKELKKFNEPA